MKQPQFNSRQVPFQLLHDNFENLLRIIILIFSGLTVVALFLGAGAD